VTFQDIANDALTEIQVLAAGETATAEDSALALTRGNYIMDEWSARRPFAYNVQFTLYTLTANHAPHLIGPGLSSPDFAATQRPVKIEGANLVLTSSTPNVDVPLKLRDDDWWNNERVKSLTSSIPTDLYYSPDWPNGSLNLWPVPSVSYGLRLETWVLLTQFAALNTAFSMPPAYRKAFMLTLAEELCGPFGKTPSAMLILKAREARKAVQGNNSGSPRIATAEAGQGGSTRGGFNWLNGGPA
jgi:hypothetical protein